MFRKLFLTSVLICAVSQGVWAWDGSGTQADPYQIQSSADWKELARQVSMGYTYSGQYFMMTADIDAEGISVGTNTSVFSGTFDGFSHTLTYNRGGADDGSIEYVNDYCAPFVRLEGATVRHLKVTGEVFSSHVYAAGIASRIGGAAATTLSDCHVSSVLTAANNLSGNASFGGLVGMVDNTCTTAPTFQNCSFTGEIQGWADCSACMVGWTSTTVTFKHCMVDPGILASANGCATYVRTPENMACTMEECYFTKAFGISQGEAVFNCINVPLGCSCSIETEPSINFDGNQYWQSGAVIRLTAPDSIGFNHWEANHSCHISDPWGRNVTHVVRDLRRMPSFELVNTMPEAKLERTMDGTRYRFLSSIDYHYYLSKEYCDQKGYYLDDDGWLVKMVDGTKVFVTAVTGWEGGSIPNDGAQIHNDLTGDWHDHTLMACIAPHAFDGCTELKTLYFKDTDATHYNAKTPFDFIIGNYAFANCPNLTEVKMMQYTTEGTNHWEALKPEQIGWVGAEVFDGSPQAYFSTDASQYQSYLNDDTWTPVNRRVVIYDHIHEDMKVNGAIYSDMRNTAGEYIKNDAAGHAALMETLRYWNADYQQFTAASLLSNSDENIWYTQVVGVEDNSLSNGTMRIYNDPGSQYNYKTIALRSLGGSKDVRAIEFWQTNGLSHNSYSDLKMVIQNSALKGCSNLEELRMYYYCQDGNERWEALGPEDVIPSDNIFGVPSLDELQNMTPEEKAESQKDIIPKNFKIIVSPDRYQDFIDDPNWQLYSSFIVARDLITDQSQMKNFEIDGLTYGYMTSPGGILQTSQTVSQDLSWWTAPRIAIEVILFAASARDIWSSFRQARNKISASLAKVEQLKQLAASAKPDTPSLELFKNLKRSPIVEYLPQMIKNGEQSVISLTNCGVNEGNIFVPLLSAKGELCTNNMAAIIINDLYSQSPVCLAFNVAIEKISYQAAELAQAEINNILQNPTTIKNFMSIASLMARTELVNTASIISSECWGGSGTYDGDAFRKGMRENILSNIHQLGFTGGGYVITTPQKNLVYHTYIKQVPDDKTEVTIYAGTGKGQGRNNNARTMTMAKDAFRNHTNLRTINFHENNVESDETLPMLFTIPDSAFAGCTNLEVLDLRVVTDDNGTQPLGPESFILAGNSVFANVDSTKFHIIIDPSRKQDFLDNESWKSAQCFFVYKNAEPKTRYQEYGGNYAYSYVNGTTRKVHKVQGHLIDHTVVAGADNSFLNEHQGALKLCNDIGISNNFQLDAVTRDAFRGNQCLRYINFTDLKGTGAFGDCYTGLEMSLQDSCFVDCPKLSDLDMLYLVTDGTNHIEPIKPSQVKIGKGVFDRTNARIKMMPQQVDWFMADSSWVKYKDRFSPCIIQPADDGIRQVLADMPYRDMAATGYDPSTWKDYIDLTRIADVGFSWLDGKFQEQKDNIRSFAEFKYFEGVGLDYVGAEWFRGLDQMTNIVLPNTIDTIHYGAFAECTKLNEIELPSSVRDIQEKAFFGCSSLKTIVLRNPEPASLGNLALPRNTHMRIYVPAESYNKYLDDERWHDYWIYIWSIDRYHVNKVVNLDKAGTLADKLGLSVEWSYSGSPIAGDEPRYIHGNYAKYDSLTISGPLNDLDLYVIRYLAGNNGYERGGKPTDGCLRYLNLYDASIVEDDNQAHYLNLSWGININWQCIQNDDELPPYLFHNCTALETVILPKSLKSITNSTFEGCSLLKRVAVTGKVETYSSWTNFDGLLGYPLEELVLLTDKYATSSAKDPWGQQIGHTYTLQSQVIDCMNDISIMSQTQSVVALFYDDHVMQLLANKGGEFFPSEYLLREDVEGIFEGSTIEDFDDFDKFENVKHLVTTFRGNNLLNRISLPASIKSIGADAFDGCTKLDTIRVLGTEPAELAADAFRSLPADFRILVPRRYAKLYRTKWTQYADHINVDETFNSDTDILTVTVTEPNTLAKTLGLEISTSRFMLGVSVLNSVRGDYSNIHKLKVIGPIGAFDIDLLKYMAGYCQWTLSRNYNGNLEYLDLYDADIKQTGEIGVNCVQGEYKKWDGTIAPKGFYVLDDMLPQHSFLRAYSLKTLILPKTCKVVDTRALQECEGLEILVLGDDMETFNWNALDDDAMLTRMYILAKKKVEIDTEFPIWRWLCNNYNPTFDAFYVRPSQYRDYLNDKAYTGSSWQRTNNISTGFFDDDASFCAFSAHGTATMDELAEVTSVKNWFDSHRDVRDLTALRYTCIDYLDKATLAPLSELEQIALPITFFEMEEGAFDANRHLRSVDFLLCDSTDVIAGLREGGLKKCGINTQQTLVYVPETYGSTTETNVVVNEGGTLRTETYRLTDSLSYFVPYEFEATKIENSRKLNASAIPYTVCIPYKMNVPKYARAYKLDSRDGTNLVFTEVKGELEAMHPYLLKVLGNKRLRRMSTTLDTDISQTIPATGPSVFGRQDDAPGYSIRGTFDAISNADAALLGAYILQSDGDWHPVSSASANDQKASILPYRAFLLPSARNASGRITMTLEDEATGIETIETIDADGTCRYYDLNGRLLDEKPESGMYINNGQKEMYSKGY